MKHHKEFEAFCTDDNKLVCIDCILEDEYSKRNIVGISKAAETQAKNLQTAVSKATEIEGKLKEKKVKVEKALMAASSQKIEGEKVVSKIYDDLIEKLLKQKEVMLMKISEEYSNEVKTREEELQNIKTQVNPKP